MKKILTAKRRKMRVGLTRREIARTHGMAAGYRTSQDFLDEATNLLALLIEETERGALMGLFNEETKLCQIIVVPTLFRYRKALEMLGIVRPLSRALRSTMERFART